MSAVKQTGWPVNLVSAEASAFISTFSAGVSLGRSLLDFVQLPIYLQQRTKETVAV